MEDQLIRNFKSSVSELDTDSVLITAFYCVFLNYFILFFLGHSHV